MDHPRSDTSESRFAAYVEGLVSVIGHADRAKPLRDYCIGLMMPCERKSVEPMTAITAPERTAAQHQSLLHFVGEGRWSDEKVLAKVSEMVLPQIERHGPIEAWIIDDTGFPKQGRHSVGVARQYCGQLGKQELVAHALTNAREALGRKLADTATQSRLLQGLAAVLGLPQPPRRVEVYDNSHIQGANAVGAMIVAGPEGFLKNQYRKFNIKSGSLTPGDDYAMMREVLERRFKRLLTQNAAGPHSAAESGQDAVPQWPDLVIIDGGLGQLNAVRAIFDKLGLSGVALMAVAKGPDRDAGRETLFLPDRPAMKLEPRDPVLYFIQRLRDEAHRFVIGSHRKLRRKDIREAGLQEVPGIGPARKRALLHHFGTLKEIERASLADLGKVPGISAESARRIFDFFHARPA